MYEEYYYYYLGVRNILKDIIYTTVCMGSEVTEDLRNLIKSALKSADTLEQIEIIYDRTPKGELRDEVLTVMKSYMLTFDQARNFYNNSHSEEVRKATEERMRQLKPEITKLLFYETK